MNDISLSRVFQGKVSSAKKCLVNITIQKKSLAYYGLQKHLESRLFTWKTIFKIYKRSMARSNILLSNMDNIAGRYTIFKHFLNANIVEDF